MKKNEKKKKHETKNIGKRLKGLFEINFSHHFPKTQQQKEAKRKFYVFPFCNSFIFCQLYTRHTHNFHIIKRNQFSSIFKKFSFKYLFKRSLFFSHF